MDRESRGGGACRLLAVVVDPAGRAIENATVLAGGCRIDDRDSTPRGQWPVALAVTDDSGRFVIEGLPAGRIDVVVQAADGASLVTQVVLQRHAACHVRLTLQRRRSTRGTPSS